MRAIVFVDRDPLLHSNDDILAVVVIDGYSNGIGGDRELANEFDGGCLRIESEHLHALIGSIGNVNDAVGVYSKPVRFVELTLLATLAAKLGN